MNDILEAEKKKVHQGHNVKVVRTAKKMYQKDLAELINKQQGDISEIESQESIDDEILNQIALALNVPVDILRTFDFESGISNSYFNKSSINAAEKSSETINQGQENTSYTYNFPVEQLEKFTEKFLNMQKDHYEKEIALIREFYEREIKYKDNLIEELKSK